MKKRSIYFLILMCLISSCTKNYINELGDAAIEDEQILPGESFPVTVEDETYCVTYQFNDDVFVLDDKDLEECLLTVEQDSILYFRSDAFPKEYCHAGAMISSGISEKTPYGLGNVILDYQVEGDVIKCTTTVAMLDELFKTLELTSSIPLLLGVEDDDSDLTRAEIGSDNGLSFQLGAQFGDLDSKGWEVSVLGKLAFNADLTFNVSLKNNTYEVSLTPSTTFAGEIAGTAKLPLMSKPIILMKPKEIKLPICQIGPVILRPYMSISTTLEAYLEGTASFSFGKTVSGTWGWTDRGQLSESGCSNNSSNDFIQDLDINGSVRADISTPVDLGLGIYTRRVALALSPELGISLSADCPFEINNQQNPDIWRINPKLSFGLGAEVSGEFVVQLFKRQNLIYNKWPFAEFDLLSLEWPLLPVLDEDSIQTEAVSMKAGLYNAEYSLTGGLLCKFIDIKPALVVESKDGDKDKKYKESNRLHYITTPSNHRFGIYDIKPFGEYIVRPAIYVFDNYYTNGSKVLNGFEFNISIGFCIDCSGSMDTCISTVKNNAVNFYSLMSDAYNEESYGISSLRANVIGFQGIGEKFWSSPMYSLPDESAALRNYISGLYTGGGDHEIGLEAISSSIDKMDWSGNPETDRNIIIIWSDEDYQGSMSLSSLKATWDSLPESKRLIVFGEGNWNNLSGWEYTTVNSNIGDAFTDIDYIMDNIIGTE